MMNFGYLACAWLHGKFGNATLRNCASVDHPIILPPWTVSVHLNTVTFLHPVHFLNCFVASIASAIQKWMTKSAWLMLELCLGVLLHTTFNLAPCDSRPYWSMLRRHTRCDEFREARGKSQALPYVKSMCLSGCLNALVRKRRPHLKADRLRTMLRSVALSVSPGNVQGDGGSAQDIVCLYSR